MQYSQRQRHNRLPSAKARLAMSPTSTPPFCQRKPPPPRYSIQSPLPLVAAGTSALALGYSVPRPELQVAIDLFFRLRLAHHRVHADLLWIGETWNPRT